MSPRPRDPDMRAALIDAAAQLLLAEGPAALTTRRVAARAGTSTMAVYTYFQNMDDLRGSLAAEGFARLAGRMAVAPSVDDPVAHVAGCGRAYFLNGLENPHLYRFMFVEQEAAADTQVGLTTFERLVEAVEVAVGAGRFSPADPGHLAAQLWAMTHGVIMLHLTGLVAFRQAVATFREAGINLFVGFGDDRRQARRSAETGGWMALEDECRPRPMKRAAAEIAATAAHRGR